jgi:4-hydroxybenzoate polyprenyltransferase
MVAAGLAAVGYCADFRIEDWHVWKILLAALTAAVLNVASNAVNQIFDLEVDRINKPERPLPAGHMTIRQAAVVTIVCYAGALGIAAAINVTMLAIVAFTAVLTYVYSGPPLRTKRHWAFSNFTISIPRGLLLPMAGWTAVSGDAAYGGRDVLPIDVWAFAIASWLFVLGAATTKDYADLEGDRAGGCITIPLKFGVERSVRFVAPFLVLPWLGWAAAVASGRLHGNVSVLLVGTLALATIGARAAWLLVKRPEALTSGSTHPAWVLMYLMMIGSQIVLAAGYVVAA